MTKIHELDKPFKGNNQFNHVTYCICGNNSDFLYAVAETAQELNYFVTINNRMTYGEAKYAAVTFVHEVKQLYLKAPERNHCIIAGGETTVTLGDEHGAGGRNQEFALSAAIEMNMVFSDLKNRCNVTLLSCGTDGIDGPTDAAGAIVDLTSLISDGYNYLSEAENALEMHDSYTFLDRINALVRTGPTETNVMDVQIVLIDNIM